MSYEPSLVLETNVTASTVTLSNFGVYKLDCTSNAITVTIPDATKNTGRKFVLKKVDTTNNVVTITTTSSQTIDGFTDHRFLTFFEDSLTIFSDGSNWQIWGSYLNTSNVYHDTWSDGVTQGFLSPTSGTLATTMSTVAVPKLSTAYAIAYVLGCRIAIPAGDTRLAFTYTLNKDTYDDLSSDGIITHTAVANNASAPAIAANSIRLQKVVSGASTISSVTQLWTPPAHIWRNPAGTVDTGLNRNGAGIVEIDNGTPGYYGDLQANNGTFGFTNTSGLAGTTTIVGTGGIQTYSYIIAAVMADGTYIIGPGFTTGSTANATLSGSNYVKLTWSAVPGAVSYNVYLTAGRVPGLLTNTTALTYNDTGTSATGTVPNVNTASVVQTGAINQLPFGVIPLSLSTGINFNSNQVGIYTNQGPIANNPDYYGDWVVTPVGITVLSSLTFTFNYNLTQTCIILIANGNRVAIPAGDSRLTNTYTASRDTYVDVDYLGNFHYTAVANGASPPALYQTVSGALVFNAMRFAKVVSNASQVTSATVLAQTSPPSFDQVIAQGRLTGLSNSVFGDTAASGNSSLYYTPDIRFGNQISLSTSSAYLNLQTFKFSQTTGGLGYSSTLSGLASGTVYDIYTYWDNPSQTLCLTASSWSNTTTPPTRNLGSDGRYYASSDYTKLLVGAVYCLNSNNVQDWYGLRGISNVYNRVTKEMYAYQTGSWTSASTTWATMNGNTTNGSQRYTWVDVLGSDTVELRAGILASNSVIAANYIGIGFNSTSPALIAAGCEPTVAGDGSFGQVAFPVGGSGNYIGVNYVQALCAVTGGTGTFYGTYTAGGAGILFTSISGSLKC